MTSGCSQAGWPDYRRCAIGERRERANRRWLEAETRQPVHSPPTANRPRISRGARCDHASTDEANSGREAPLPSPRPLLRASSIMTRVGRGQARPATRLDSTRFYSPLPSLRPGPASAGTRRLRRAGQSRWIPSSPPVMSLSWDEGTMLQCPRARSGGGRSGEGLGWPSPAGLTSMRSQQMRPCPYCV